jgi:hypothetical protein
VRLKYFREQVDPDPPSAQLWDDVDTTTQPHTVGFWQTTLKVDAASAATRTQAGIAALGAAYVHEGKTGEGVGLLLEAATYKGPDDSDFALLRLARDEQLGDLPRALEIMDYFLSGSACRPDGGRSKLVFNMSELLTACPGAREHVKDEIHVKLKRVLAKLDGGKPAASTPRYGFGDVYMAKWGEQDPKKLSSYSEFEFPIAQNDYQNNDWKNALGTFFCIWVPDRSGTLPRSAPPPHAATPPPPTRAIIGGKKIWRWHSKTDRPSEAVHQAAYRLVQKGKLVNFRVEAEPCFVDIANGYPVGEVKHWTR